MGSTFRVGPRFQPRRVATLWTARPGPGRISGQTLSGSHRDGLLPKSRWRQLTCSIRPLSRRSHSRSGQNSVPSPDAIRFSWLDTWAVSGDVGGLWRRRGRGGFATGGRGLRCPGWVRRGRSAGGHRRSLSAGRNRRSLGASGCRRGRSGRRRWRRLGERGAGGLRRRWGLRECRRERGSRRCRQGWSSRKCGRGRHVGGRRDRRLGERRGRRGRHIRKFRTGRSGG
jgi:hypothetical protein